ncbi:isocitrate dehydrogenase kinase/phosphatase AceK regulatory subunit [Shigella flexneri]
MGKLITPSGTLPLLLPIHETDDGELFIDTCLTTTAEASIVFGFARSYYGLCTAARSAGGVATGNLPGKTTAELYMAIYARSTPKPKATANISFIYRAVMSSSLKRRVFVEW